MNRGLSITTLAIGGLISVLGTAIVAISMLAFSESLD